MRRTQKETEDSARKITRRGLLAAGVQLGFLGVLALRMRQLQVEEADQFRLLAEENRVNIRLLPPARGVIYDRDGHALAENEQNYRIVIVREDAGDVETTLKRVAELVPVSTEEFEKAVKEIKRRSPFVPVTVADWLTWEDLAKIAVNAPALPGVIPEVGLSRSYPFGADYAHIVGYVGPVSDYDLSRIEDRDPLLQIPKFQIGKTGVENKLERRLRGKAGSKRIEVNAVGRIMRELGRNEGRPGANVQLTIDSALQNFVQARLGKASASAVLMNVRNGDLLAIGSTPSFDPNLFVRGISVADYDELTGNAYRPLANKAVQGTYPPGSTFKMITILAALEEALIEPEETIHCPGFTELGGRRFHCWKGAGHGKMNLRDGLSQSCDVYYYDLATRVGIEKIGAMARKLGLGTRYDLPMSAVAEGLVPTKAWKREKRGADWVVGDTLNAVIGQGFVLSSPLQLAVMVARLAAGTAVSPRLVKSIDGVETPNGPGNALDLNSANLRLVQQAMFDAVNHQRGTAYGSRVIEDRMRIAGKTGTSQVRSITEAERARGVIQNRNLPWRQRDHALFTGFAPFEAPRYAVSVVIEHGGSGAEVAAPIARDILLQALYGTLPPLSAYPTSQRGRIEEMQNSLRLRDPRSQGDGEERSRA
ncbi:MAG: penicillin-binding protein 2 [Pseudomonadota bacterium]